MTKCISLGLVLVAAWSSAAPPQPADLLSSMRASIEGYAQLAPSLVAREEYVQNMSDSRGKEERRTLLSELLMVRLPGSAGWLSFRDVLSVDNRAVAGRQQRLLELLQSPKPDAMAEARRLAGESARFNVGRIVRALNLPDMALGYLRAAYAARIRFRTIGRRMRRSPASRHIPTTVASRSRPARPRQSRDCTEFLAADS